MEQILMHAVVQERRRELGELLRHSGYGTTPERARRTARSRSLGRLRRALPGSRGQRGSTV